jgi:hypothetical protein
MRISGAGSGQANRGLGIFPLTPAEAGVQNKNLEVRKCFWIPAYAGMNGDMGRSTLLSGGIRL